MAAIALTGAAAVIRNIAFPLFATGSVGATVAQLGLLAGSTVAASIVMNLLIGRFSDRMGERHRLVAGLCLWIGAGYVIAGLAPSLGLLFVLGVLCFSLTAVPTGQLFAAGSELIQGHRRPKLMMSALRASFSLGYALGPLLAGRMIASAGLRPAMICVAIPWILAALTMRRGMASPGARPQRSPQPPWSRSVILFFLAFGLMSLVDVVRSGFLAVFARNALAMPVDRVALLFTTHSAVNLALMPLAGMLADRFGARRLVLGGAAVGALGVAATGFVTSSRPLFALAALHSVYVAGVFSVGLTLAHDLAEDRPGFGIGVYSAALQFGGLAGMVVGGFVAERTGWRALFVMSAIGGVMGMAVLACLPRPVRTADLSS
jgi:MFS family permease